MPRKKIDLDNELQELTEKKQIELINIIYKESCKNIVKITDEFEKWKWNSFVKKEDPEYFFYILILIEVYSYDALLRGRYNAEVCNNIMVTMLEQHAKNLEKDSDTFIVKAIQDITEMSKSLNESVNRGIDVFYAMFLYLVNESCNVPEEVLTNSKEVLPLSVISILKDTSRDFPKLIKNL